MKRATLAMIAAALVILGAAGWLAAQDQQASEAPQTYTGTVSDSMCGAKHEGDAKACTLKCIDQGAQWALVVGDKVYTLTGKTDDLKQFAGGRATVTGKLDADNGSIEVTAVAAAEDSGA
ncbi:MAG TPA: hypothetical protein VE996_10410 [Terriglobales bacterium]|nr:hypothetical protein [Terriglobales bacterium]